MFFAYFDESGDTGFVGTPSTCFVLSCVVVSEENWLPSIDELIRFRKYLKDQFKIKYSDELKAVNLVKTKGPFSHLSPSAAMRVYEQCLRFQAKFGKLRTFAVVIDKGKIFAKNKDVRDIAWTYAIERIERLCEKGAGGVPSIQGYAMLFPDDGYGDFLKKKVRRHRRHHLVPSAFNDDVLARAAPKILEDPCDRKSSESYFVQLADLNAFAAHRHIAPTQTFGAAMWDMLGSARVEQVNEVTRSKDGPRPPTGIVVWPS